MIQFNLLPDIKLEFIRAKKAKRLVVIIAGVLAVASLAVFLVLFIAVNVVQRNRMNDLSRQIEDDSRKLQAVENLDKVLTVQNQLGHLSELHSSKPATTRVKQFVGQVTPANASFSKIEVNFVDNKIIFTGSADSLKTVNQFADTLKFTKFMAETTEEAEGSPEPQGGSEEESKPEMKHAFSQVVVTEFGRDEKGASYQIELAFDPQIFDNKLKVTLDVPKIVTTRSLVAKPDQLFQPLKDPEGGE